MSNKLAGQRAKYTKALSSFRSTDDEDNKSKFARYMAEVLSQAAQNGFTVDQVTQGAEIPVDVQQLVQGGLHFAEPPPDDPDQLVREMQQMVDTAELQETGSGSQFVYAYGYRCAPDRLKIGRSEGDVIKRIASQIATGTPDKPALFLTIKTDHCRSLERAIHSVLEVHGRKVSGGGDEWYRTTCQEVMQIYMTIVGAMSLNG